jgi:protein transport protein SEC23
MFRESYKKLFEVDQNGEMKLAVAAKVEIWVSRELKIQGAIGSCVSLKKNGPMVSD